MLTLTKQGDDLTLAGAGETHSVRLTTAQQDELSAISQAYQTLLAQQQRAAEQQAPLRTLGVRLWDWLRAVWSDSRTLAGLPTQRLDIRIDRLRTRNGAIDPLGLLLLQAPWEILADAEGHFAQGWDTDFLVVRYLHSPHAASYAPADRRLSLVFMAASPDGQTVLDYDQEELAIEQAAGWMQFDLSVEESGNAAQLNRSLHSLYAEQIAVHALHLSCHGTAQTAGQPVLCLEDELGAPELMSADDLNQTVLQQHPIPLVFVSACQTQQAGSNGTLDYASELVLRGTPCVLAWAGSVRDTAATEFAATYYNQINQRQPPGVALERARNQLLQSRAEPYRDWHLPRLLLTQQTGDQPIIRNNQRAGRAEQRDLPGEFLDQAGQIKVANRAEFVGRRREIQAVLRYWRHTDPAQACHSVMLQGSGDVGKSSIAARIAHRYPDYERIVLFGQDISPQRLLQALNAQYRHTGRKETLQTLQPRLWPDLHAPYPDCAPLLRYCWQHEAEFNKPLLIVLDDLEQVLNDQVPAPRPCREPRVQHLLQDLISTLHQYRNSRARLLLTSRYGLSLPPTQTAQLAVVPVNPFSGPDRARQLQRQHLLWQQHQKDHTASVPHAAELLEQAVGNPGLQHLLTRVAHEAPDQISALLHQIRHWRADGTAPSDETLHHKVSQLGLQVLHDQLRNGEQKLLRASQLWPAPLPAAALAALAQHYGLDIMPAGARLSSMSLWQDHRTARAPEPTWRLNPLAESVLLSLDETEQRNIARRILPALADCWPGPELTDTQQHTLLWLALAAQDSDLIRQHTVPVLRQLNRITDYRTGSPLAARTLAAVRQLAIEMPFEYWRIAAELLQRHPDTIQQARTCFAVGAQQLQSETIDRGRTGHFHLRYAELLMQDGQIKEAEEQIQHAIEQFQHMKQPRVTAIAQGTLAQIRKNQGEVSEALALHEKRLDVFAALDDQRSRAATLGDIARIRSGQGEVSEALALLEEALKVFETLGDQHSYAVTLGDIARIRAGQGEVSEALALHKEELKVYEALGDHRARAVTLGGIARIRTAQGEVSAALALHTERLSVHRQLGDVDGIANSQWDLAQTYLQQGDTEQAMPCLLESFQLFQQTGRVDGLSIVGQLLGYILLQHGASEEGAHALRISQQAYQKLGKTKEVAQIQAWLDEHPVDA